MPHSLHQMDHASPPVTSSVLQDPYPATSDHRSTPSLKNPRRATSSPPSPWATRCSEPRRLLACPAHGPWIPPALPTRHFSHHRPTSPHRPRLPSCARHGDRTVCACAHHVAGMSWQVQLGHEAEVVGRFWATTVHQFLFLQKSFSIKISRKFL
jgi:hypothetical protein